MCPWSVITNWSYPILKGHSSLLYSKGGCRHSMLNACIRPCFIPSRTCAHDPSSGSSQGIPNWLRLCMHLYQMHALTSTLYHAGVDYFGDEALLNAVLQFWLKNPPLTCVDAELGLLNSYLQPHIVALLNTLTDICLATIFLWGLWVANK